MHDPISLSSIHKKFIQLCDNNQETKLYMSKVWKKMKLSKISARLHLTQLCEIHTNNNNKMKLRSI